MGYTQGADKVGVQDRLNSGKIGAAWRTVALDIDAGITYKNIELTEGVRDLLCGSDDRSPA